MQSSPGDLFFQCLDYFRLYYLKDLYKFDGSQFYFQFLRKMKSEAVAAKVRAYSIPKYFNLAKIGNECIQSTISCAFNEYIQYC